MKLFICNKAGRPECGYCIHQQSTTTGARFGKCTCARTGVECWSIRYRHPFEVAILKKIALIRSFRECFGSGTENWIAHQMNINLLRDVLKAGRNAV